MHGSVCSKTSTLAPHRHQGFLLPGAGVHNGCSTIWRRNVLLPLCTMKNLRHNTYKPIRVEGTPDGRRGQRCSWDGSRGSDGIR